VDPTLGAALRTAGYDDTIAALDRVEPVAVAEHAARMRCTPARPARHPVPVRVAHGDRRIRRTPGVRLDLGGIGKGLTADRLAPVLARLDRWTIDIGGDVRVGGTRCDLPQTVHVLHPLDGTAMADFALLGGAVATSAVTARAWRGPDGSPAHHLLDPSTGRPAWTGLLQATAVAASGVDAERLAKEALLRGPGEARVLLARHGGGALVDAHGGVERIGRAA
jgi:thiamine biosynthesis lipoprotein